MSLNDPVDVEKLRAFQNKVYQMAREEFGTDDEGRINKVHVICLDRSRYWPMHWFQVPYDHKAKTDQDREEILRALLRNLQIATDEMKTHLDVHRLARRKPETP